MVEVGIFGGLVAVGNGGLEVPVGIRGDAVGTAGVCVTPGLLVGMDVGAGAGFVGRRIISGGKTKPLKGSGVR